MQPSSAYLALGSITDPIVNFVVDVVDKVGYIGIFILMTLESACIPFPSEPTMLAAGFATSADFAGENPLKFMPVVLVGTAANVLGSWIGYAIGYYGRVEALEKHKWIHLDPKQIARTERWFEQHGGATVFFARLLPIVRTFISLPAGAARMPLGRFTVYTAAGCFIWMFALTYLGRLLGDNWREFQEKLHLFDYVIAAVIIGTVLYFAYRWYKGRGTKGDSGTPTPEDDSAPVTTV